MSAGVGRPVIFTLAWLCAGLSLFAPLARAGIWDPHELEVAELARRIAVNLMDAPSLALTGLDNRVPILSELGRGQLPFSSVALGFKVFGLHDWAGRLPLALWGLFGMGASYLLVRRLLDRAAAPYAVLLLASCPLYFLHSRTMLGDVVTMASLALACAGLGLAVFDPLLKPKSGGWWAALAAGALGLVCGFGSRGALFGVALPCLSIALTALLLAPLVPLRWRSANGIVVGGSLLLGLGALGIGVWAITQATPEHYSLWVGTEVAPLKKAPTHDSVLHALGHGLMPWSALLPFALGALFRPTAGTAPVGGPEAALRTLLLTVSTLAVLVHGLSSPYLGEVPFVAVFALAAAVAVLFRDMERGRAVSLATGIGALALLVLLVMDYRQFPEKAFSAFVVGDGKVPDSFTDIGKRYLMAGAGLAVLGCLVGFWERDRKHSVLQSPHASPPGFIAALRAKVGRLLSAAGVEAADYWVWPYTLRDLFRGNPLYVLVPIELVLFALFIAEHAAKKGFHVLPALWLVQVPKPVIHYGWAAVLALFAFPLLILAIRDAMRVVLCLLPVTRASVAAFGFAAFGLIFSLGYYPALASQVSPREVFDAFRKFAQEGDELGMVGSTGAAAYYTGGNTQVFAGTSDAATWLLEEKAPRRYLVLASSDLVKLNSQYRAKVSPVQNLPVVDARSSEIFLVSNQMGGSDNQNPLVEFVLDAKPTPQTPAVCSFEDEIDCIGWEVASKGGEVVDSLATGGTYLFRIYYSVRTKVSGSWKTFIHIDGAERINLDHDTTAGRYPMNLWNKGDFILDEHEFQVPRGQAKGKYSVNFGLFQGSRRKKVTQGEHADNRINVGDIEIH